MAENVTVRIGGEEVAVPLILNLEGLERAWPHIRALSSTVDPLDRVLAACGLIAGALLSTRPEFGLDTIMARLRIRSLVPWMVTPKDGFASSANLDDLCFSIASAPLRLNPLVTLADVQAIRPAAKEILSGSLDPVQVVVVCAAVAARNLKRDDLTLPEIKKRLRVNIADGTDERPRLVDAVNALLLFDAGGEDEIAQLPEVADRLIRESGLLPAGEAPPPPAP